MATGKDDGRGFGWGWVLAVLACWVAGCGGGGEGGGYGGRGDALVVGMELTYPPFEMLDAAGEPDGVGVRLAEAMGEHLGREVEIENIQFDGLITALKTGKIDLIVSSMTANDVRRQSIDFSEPYVRTGLSLLVAKGSGIGGIDDIKGEGGSGSGRTVAVKLGTTGELYARAELPGAELVVLDSQDACVLEVMQGKADAFIYDQLSVYGYAQQHPEALEALLYPFQREVWAVGVRKGDDALREEVNGFLEAFRESGGFDDLAERYLKDERAMLEAQGVPFIF